jgi:hypothetical protein
MSANSNIKEKVENGAVDALDVCAEFMARSMRLTIESTTRSAAHRLGGRLVSGEWRPIAFLAHCMRGGYARDICTRE